MARPPIYKDDKLKTRAIRLSEKYELDLVLSFIKIIRKFREQAISFVKSFDIKDKIMEENLQDDIKGNIEQNDN